MYLIFFLFKKIKPKSMAIAQFILIVDIKK